MLIRLARKAAFSRAGFLTAGAALMYFWDPDRGRSRRVQIASQARAAPRRRIRQTVHQSERRAHYVQGRLRGAAVKARGGGSYHPESDADLREHLRQVIRSLAIPTGDVTVDAAKGIATLRGQVRSDHDQAALRAAVAAVPGVTNVEDFMHLPGMMAPNKAAARVVPHQP
jgi:hypothetical protein